MTAARSDYSTLRYAKITWRACADGFYDGLFPDACKGYTSGLSVGVTVSAAWDLRDLGNSSMIRYDDAMAQVKHFQENGPDPNAFVRLLRNTGELKYRRIGYKTFDSKDLTELACAGSVGLCDDSSYYFKINHLSPDRNVFFCRLSFTASLATERTMHVVLICS